MAETEGDAEAAAGAKAAADTAAAAARLDVFGFVAFILYLAYFYLNLLSSNSAVPLAHLTSAKAGAGAEAEAAAETEAEADAKAACS